ncbi:hybrid sensor histidine kinase/response regulator [Aquabacterium humicola]|uniref:hybrid sensor histidine kinase/response regulator n=1 Tax=Aquabacterium humicola TaxID=3237377 RepID=UPI0025434833|nr:ATP-binding protein [Rubrivivax pictus]
MATRRVSLRRLFARQFMLVAALPPLVAALAWGLLTLPDAWRRVEAENQLTQALVHSHISSALQMPERSLQLTADLLRGTGSDAASELLQRSLAHTGSFDLLMLADADGTVRAAAAHAHSGVRAQNVIGLDLSAQPYFAAAKQAAGTLVRSDSFLSSLTGRVTAVLALSLGDRVLVADLSLDRLAAGLPRPDPASGALVIVLDAKGRVIVHPEQQLANWQENLAQLGPVRAALGGRPASGPISYRGEDWIATIAPAQSTGWLVLVAQPRSRVVAPLLRIAAVAAGISLLALLLGLLMASRMARGVSRRYRQMADAAQALVDHPDQAPDPEQATEEAQQLWLRMAALLDQLRGAQRRAEAAQGRLQAVLDAATEVSVIAFDAAGTVRMFNRGATKMLGYAADEVVGRRSIAEFHDAGELATRAAELAAAPGAAPQPLDVLTTVAHEAGYEIRDWTYVCRGGSRLLVSVATTALHDGDGTPAGFLCIALDQTQRQRAASAELAREAAETASRTKTEFLSRVSHELRTPLNAMLGYAQLLTLDAAHPLSASQQDRVRHIEGAGWHLLRLIDDLLDLSRIESGRMQLDLKPLALGSVLHEALRLVAPQAQAASVRLHDPAADDGAAGAVLADATRLQQVLVNLLSNAIKYNRAGGEVQLRLQRHHVDGIDEVGIVVADTGRGMSPEQLQRLYSPFDRLGLENSMVPGAGLGLVISRRLVELMNGRLEVDSVPGEGSRFCVWLPAAPAAAHDGAAPAEGATPLPAPSGVHRILYIEDNPVNATLMREVVALRPGHTLQVCTTLADGRAAIERQPPALVLVDLHLPDGSGLSLLSWLQAEPARARIPAVLVSADATPQQRELALARGAAAYLTKPIRVDETLQTIGRLLDEAPPARLDDGIC